MKTVKLRLLQPWNMRDRGTVIETYRGVATDLIRMQIAEAYEETEITSGKPTDNSTDKRTTKSKRSQGSSKSRARRQD